GARNFYAFTSTTNTGIYRYAGTNINPSNPGTASGITNIINQIMFNMDLAVADPSSFTATAANETQINLSWTKNPNNDNVMVAYSPGGSVGTPADGTQYAVNDNIPGGGTVIYNGGGTSFNHTALYPNTTYNYKVWSIGDDGSKALAYSQGVSASAKTPLTDYLVNEGFTATTFPPTGWTRSQTTWTRVNITTPSFIGGASQFRRTAAGNANTALLVTPALTVPSDDYSVSFRMNRTATAGTEQLRVYINSQPNLTGATQLGTINRYTQSSPTVRDAGWYKYTLDFPAGSTGTRYVIFEGYSTTTTATLAIQIDDVSVSKITKTYPIQDPRFVAEWEPAMGAIVSYYNGFGVPNSMLVDLSNEGKLYVVRPSGSATTVNNALTNAGVNMSNVTYITSALDSYWIRDYGPLTIFDGNNQMKFIDFEYNRARYNDNGVNAILSNDLGYDIFPMNYVATGGNVMSDSYGKAMSTDLIQRENPLSVQAEIDEMFANYLGISEYQIYADPLTDSTIDHMDTWAKILDVDIVMVSRVPSNHANYASLEAAAAQWASTISSYGTPYRVFRVDCGSALAPYINSFIYNKKIYVPQANNNANAQDNAAFQAYRNAMPDYEVKGYYINSWLSDDALHCRVNTIHDEEMIFVYHIPIQTAYANSTVTICSDITSTHSVVNDSTYISYQYWDSSTNKYTDWITVPLTLTSGNTWCATIPTPPMGHTLLYTIRATDSTGRVVNRSNNGRLDPYVVVMEPTQTTPVQLSSFTGFINPLNQVTLQWVTQSETNLAGFRIYRNLDDDFAEAMMLNAFIEGTNTSQTQVYVFNDTDVFDEGTYYYWLESYDIDATSNFFGPIMVEFRHDGNSTPDIPIIHGINACYPNPFNPSTTIKFGVPVPGVVKIDIYNQKGQLVKNLFNDLKYKGVHSVLWNGTDNYGKSTSSGIYYVRMTNAGETFTHKILLMK
ncbi:MAG: T9SS type A sorting domain-containing protein, partial [Candidatus Cloacimonetes bacterium]|nr:T9SS type A sorting domain-containing protein [Candidatus Cloacimonadota bacterium]